jgi:peptidoglycan/LPS O-acetylase OafA/YrhL
MCLQGQRQEGSAYTVSIHSDDSADGQKMTPKGAAAEKLHFSTKNMESGYRPDIDGLRAIAVAIVVVFHTGISPLRGGFIGVDIFFVISGYLITRLIANDLERGRFTIAGFYERRIRRIFPALLVAIAAVLCAAPLLLFPSELKTTGLTAIASVASVANLYLLTSAGYFAGDAETQPLIHMWSLGVEEQFYLFFPLLLSLFGAQRLVAARWAVFGLTGFTFVLCVVATYANRDFAYFFPLTRAWELLVGALLVFISVPRLPRLLREIVAVGAVAVILVGAYKIHAGMYFPGFIALAPCVAAATLIAVGGAGGSLVSQVLSQPPMLFIGRLSYSLYLWHWPVFVGYRLVRGTEISPLEAAGLVLASVVAASLSWRFVEQPFREKRLLSGRVPLFTVAAASCLGLIAVAATLATFSTSLSESGAEATRFARYLGYDEAPVYRRGTCFLFGHTDSLADFDVKDCLTPAAGKLNVLVVGDSHGAHLWAGLHDVLPQANVMQATSTGCKPVLASRGEATCRELMAEALGPFLDDNKPDILVLSARWLDGDVADVGRTIESLRNKVGRLVVFGPVPEYTMALPRLLAQVADGRDPSLLIAARRMEPSAVDKALGDAVRGRGATYVSSYRLLCPSDTSVCMTLTGTTPLQWDYGHLTREGSVYLADQARRQGALAIEASE